MKSRVQTWTNFASFYDCDSHSKPILTNLKSVQSLLLMRDLWRFSYVKPFLSFMTLIENLLHLCEHYKIELISTLLTFGANLRVAFSSQGRICQYNGMDFFFLYGLRVILNLKKKKLHQCYLVGGISTGFH